MIKLFFKTLYTIFLWIILLANLFIFFHMTDLVINPSMIATGRNLDNAYFGVSTLINAFKNIDQLPISGFAMDVGKTQRDLYSMATDIFTSVDWEFTADLFSNASDIIEWFKALWSALVNIFNYVRAIGIFIGGAFTMVFYFVLMIFSIVYTLMGLFNGYYANEVPPHLLWSFACKISNCITPLMSAVVGV